MESANRSKAYGRRLHAELGFTWAVRRASQGRPEPETMECGQEKSLSRRGRLESRPGAQSLGPVAKQLSPQLTQ